MRTGRAAEKLRLCALISQNGLLCWVTTSDDPRWALKYSNPPTPILSLVMPALRLLSGSWNFSLASRWGGLRKKPRWRVPLPPMGRFLAGVYSRSKLQRKTLERSETNAGTFVWAFYPSSPNRWLGQDTCKAAGSRRLRAALRPGSTVSVRIRSPNILGPVRSFPRPKNLFLDSFQSIRRTELPISASHPWPRNLSRRLLSSLGFFQVCQARKSPPARAPQHPGSELMKM